MIRFLINILIYVILIDAVISFFPSVRDQNWAKSLKSFVDKILDPIRRLLPRELPFDFSPLVAILLLNLLILLW